MVERRRDSCRSERQQQNTETHSAGYAAACYFPRATSYKTRFGWKPNALRAIIPLALVVVGSAVALWSLGLSFRSALLNIQPVSSRIGSSAFDADGTIGAGGRDMNALSADQLAIALSLRQLGKPRESVSVTRRADDETLGGSNAGDAEAVASARAADDAATRGDEGAEGQVMEGVMEQGEIVTAVAGGMAEGTRKATGAEMEADGHAEEQKEEGESGDAGGAAEDAAEPDEYRPPTIIGKLPKPGSRRAVALRNILQLDIVAANTTASAKASMLVPARPTSASKPQDGFQALRAWLSKQKKRALRDGSTSARRGADKLRLGVVNLDATDTKRARARFPEAVFRPLPFSAPPADLTWVQLFPEWIDEKNPKPCPALPWPQWAGPGNGTVMWPDSEGDNNGADEVGDDEESARRAGSERSGNGAAWSVREEHEVDALIVRVPCEGLSVFNASWARDVARHHLLLLAASGLAAQSQVTDFPVLLLTHCLPPPSIFHCSHLVASVAASWLFAIPPPAMRARLRNAPVGTCQLYPTPPRLPPATSPAPQVGTEKQAWATVLHSSDKYICGALALARSLRRVGTRHEMVAFVSKEVSQRAQRSLALAGWKVVAVGRMRSSFKASSNYCKYNHSKLRLWQMAQYSKLIFLDTDMLVLRNLDHLFAMPELTAVSNNQFQFNGGLLVVDPSPCTFAMLKDALALFETYNDCEQGLLNELYPWWHRLPQSTNFLKFAWSSDPEVLAHRRATLSAQPPVVDMVHYLGAKPWYCYRDFDCNLLSTERQFADDLAFDMWWKVHDEMSEEEQQQCWMPTWTKAALRAAMEKMRLLKEDPRLWNVTIADPRDNKCRDWEEKYSCDWRAMQSVLDEPKHFRF
ncbi:unnamed protein product [Closterium sp. Naga37s-1]|nr:unnamed protein product [Closterium sp. Naga37s-1]